MREKEKSWRASSKKWKKNTTQRKKNCQYWKNNLNKKLASGKRKRKNLKTTWPTSRKNMTTWKISTNKKKWISKKRSIISRMNQAKAQIPSRLGSKKPRELTNNWPKRPRKTGTCFKFKMKNLSRPSNTWKRLMRSYKKRINSSFMIKRDKDKISKDNFVKEEKRQSLTGSNRSLRDTTSTWNLSGKNMKTRRRRWKWISIIWSAAIHNSKIKHVCLNLKKQKWELNIKMLLSCCKFNLITKKNPARHLKVKKKGINWESNTSWEILFVSLKVRLRRSRIGQKKKEMKNSEKQNRSFLRWGTPTKLRNKPTTRDTKMKFQNSRGKMKTILKNLLKVLRRKRKIFRMRIKIWSKSSWIHKKCSKINQALCNMKLTWRKRKLKSSAKCWLKSGASLKPKKNNSGEKNNKWPQTSRLRKKNLKPESISWLVITTFLRNNWWQLDKQTNSKNQILTREKAKSKNWKLLFQFREKNWLNKLANCM